MEEKNRDIYDENPKAFIDYLQTINDAYENLEDHNPTKKKSVKSISSYNSRYGS